MNDVITTTTPEPTETLTLATPCDACGYSDGWPVARAYVLCRLTNGGTLAFCGHHYAAYETDLLPLLDSIDDERTSLTVKRESGF